MPFWALSNKQIWLCFTSLPAERWGWERKVGWGWVPEPVLREKKPCCYLYKKRKKIITILLPMVLNKAQEFKSSHPSSLLKLTFSIVLYSCVHHWFLLLVSTNVSCMDVEVINDVEVRVSVSEEDFGGPASDQRTSVIWVFTACPWLFYYRIVWRHAQNYHLQGTFSFIKGCSVLLWLHSLCASLW